MQNQRYNKNAKSDQGQKGKIKALLEIRNWTYAKKYEI